MSKRSIKAAIKAAGLNVVDFQIESDCFESVLSDTRKANAQARKVAKELVKVGVSVETHTCAHGGIFVNIGVASNGVQHTITNNHPASVRHY